VAEFPFDLQEEQSHVFYSLTHGKPILGGFFNAFPPQQYRRIRPVMAGFPSQEAVDLLLDLGVQYVIVQTKMQANHSEVDALLRSSGFNHARLFESESVYELTLPAQPREMSK
jgi:hypothetical protein